MRPMGLGTGKIKTTQMAVALLFPEDVSREIDEVRERFGSARARAIVPHITVVYPFVALARTDVVIEELKPVAAMTKPFPIVLDGFNHFDGEPAVAFITVKNPKPVAELHSTVLGALEGLREGGSEFELAEFVPHVTLNDSVSRDDIGPLMSELSKVGFRREVTVDSFGLFVNDGEGWELIHQFRLGKT